MFAGERDEMKIQGVRAYAWPTSLHNDRPGRIAPKDI